MARLKSVSLMHRLMLLSYTTVLCVCWFCLFQALRGSLNNKIEGLFESALSEQFRVGNSIKTMAENKRYSQENRRYYLMGAIKNGMESYSQYYSGNDSFFQVQNQNGELVFSNFPESLSKTSLTPKQDGSVEYCISAHDSKKIILVSSYLKIYSELFRFDYARDVTDPISGELALANRISWTLLLSLVFLTGLLYIGVRNALKPLNNLGEQAMAIAGGTYSLRVRQVRDDEVGRLAKNFNHMAEAVEKHINTVTESAELRELFAANLAHEIKNPITSIIGYADYALRKELDGEELHRIHNYIKREGKRLDSLSQKLLEWSEIGRRKEAEQRPCDAIRLINHVLMTAAPAIEGKHQKILTKCSVKALFVDEVLFTSLLTNLLFNASRASDKDGVIELSMDLMESPDNRLTVCVKDYGVGIDKEDIGRITEPFYMADKARDRRNYGSGLGLALCLAVVGAHRGEMKIESQINKGTVVVVEIPQPETLTTYLQSLDSL